MVCSVYKRQWFKVTGKRKFKKAMNVDILGNFFYGETLEWLFSKSGYQFGRFGETISSCLGKKFIEKTLNFHGLIWYYILYGIDFTKWKKQGHCIANIQPEAEINNYLIK